MVLFQVASTKRAPHTVMNTDIAAMAISASMLKNRCQSAGICITKYDTLHMIAQLVLWSRRRRT